MMNESNIGEGLGIDRIDKAKELIYSEFSEMRRKLRLATNM
jgi:hypothetical protein